tara:strand:- start:2408 stop:2974 length:567 start_codon:yes stop_codon:yes gene_type:complete
MNKNIIAILSLILAVVVYLIYIQDLYSEVSVIRAENESLQQNIEQVDNFIDLQRDLSNRLGSFSQGDLDRLEEFLPDRVNAIQTILDIQELSRKNGLILTGSISVEGLDSAVDKYGAEKSQDDTLFHEVTFGFSVLGPYNNLTSFLSEVAKSLKIYNIPSVSFSADETGINSYVIKLETFQLTDNLLQ